MVKNTAKNLEKKPGNVPEDAPPGLFINDQYLKDLYFENLPIYSQPSDRHCS